MRVFWSKYFILVYIFFPVKDGHFPIVKTEQTYEDVDTKKTSTLLISY